MDHLGSEIQKTGKCITMFQRFGFSQVMDGELVFRINSKTIKKVNVTLGPPIKPQPPEKREPTDTNPAPSEEVDVDNNQSVEELSDNEAAEKENIENFEGTSQKAETARARVANKVKIIRNLMGAQWLSGRVLDSRPRGPRFEPHGCHCVVSLSNTHLSLLSTGSTQEDLFRYN